jgi:hypothetical protein
MAIFAHYGKKGDVRSIYTFSPFFWSAVWRGTTIANLRKARMHIAATWHVVF